MTSKNRSYAAVCTLLAGFAVLGCDLGSDAGDDDSAGSDEGETEGDEDPDTSDPSGDTEDTSDPDETGSNPDTGPDSDSDSDSDTGPSGDALADSVFLFIHDNGDNTDTVHAYDVATDESWLVADFDNSTEIRSVAIHPDRTSIAVSAFYQLADADESEGIWRVSTAGGEPENIMEAIAGDTDEFQSVANLVYSPDGGHVYFDYSTNFGGGNLARVSVGGGLPDMFFASNGECTGNGAPSLSPDGSQMLSLRTGCIDPVNEGLVAYAAPPADLGQVLIPGSANYSMRITKSHWLGDGSGLLLVMGYPFDSDGDGINDGDGESVQYLEFASAELFTLIPPADDQLISSFAVSPDETALVMCIDAIATQDLWLADLSGEAITYRALTSDGESCHVTW